MKCKGEGCENERHLSDSPEVFIFGIPFTSIEIRIYNWNHKKEEEYCIDCLMESEPVKYSDAQLEAIFNDGYTKGLW